MSDKGSSLKSTLKRMGSRKNKRVGVSPTPSSGSLSGGSASESSGVPVSGGPTSRRSGAGGNNDVHPAALAAAQLVAGTDAPQEWDKDHIVAPSHMHQSEPSLRSPAAPQISDFDSPRATPEPREASQHTQPQSHSSEPPILVPLPNVTPVNPSYQNAPPRELVSEGKVTIPMGPVYKGSKSAQQAQAAQAQAQEAHERAEQAYQEHKQQSEHKHSTEHARHPTQTAHEPLALASEAAEPSDGRQKPHSAPAYETARPQAASSKPARTTAESRAAKAGNELKKVQVIAPAVHPSHQQNQIDHGGSPDPYYGGRHSPAPDGGPVAPVRSHSGLNTLGASRGSPASTSGTSLHRPSLSRQNSLAQLARSHRQAQRGDTNDTRAFYNGPSSHNASPVMSRKNSATRIGPHDADDLALDYLANLGDRPANEERESTNLLYRTGSRIHEDSQEFSWYTETRPHRQSRRSSVHIPNSSESEGEDDEDEAQYLHMGRRFRTSRRDSNVDEPASGVVTEEDLENARVLESKRLSVASVNLGADATVLDEELDTFASSRLIRFTDWFLGLPHDSPNRLGEVLKKQRRPVDPLINRRMREQSLVGDPAWIMALAVYVGDLATGAL